MALLEKEKWEGDAIGIEYSITDVTSPLPPRQTVLLDDESLAWLTKVCVPNSDNSQNLADWEPV